MTRHFCLFETSLGLCAVAWTDQGVVRFQLPEKSERELRRSMSDAKEVAPPAWIRALIGRVQKHLAGKPQDFTAVKLDFAGAPAFSEKVWRAALTIPAGETRTYGELARVLGSPRAARAVGQALGRNPVTLIVPCHRVVPAGKMGGGFSAFGGLKTKTRLLQVEGAVD